MVKLGEIVEPPKSQSEEGKEEEAEAAKDETAKSQPDGGEMGEEETTADEHYGTPTQI